MTDEELQAIKEDTALIYDTRLLAEIVLLLKKLLCGPENLDN